MNCMIFVKIVGYVDESWMISLLAVYELYYIHKNIGMLLQKIATNTFSSVGCFLHFFLLGKSRLSFYEGARMGRIFQLAGLCSLCPLLVTWLIARQYFPYEDCSISLITTYFHFILVTSCVYRLLSFPYA